MNRLLATIVAAQFFCTSVWFAANAILADLVLSLHLDASFLAHLTSAVQLGFITGTLLYALLTIADRFSPSKVFFVSAVLAAACNGALVLESAGSTGLLLFRFFTGFFLAGIYPVGMKIASDYHQKGLGAALGFLVGALVLGTALPHGLRSVGAYLPWRYVVYATSALALLGGALIGLGVPDGPYRKKAARLQLQAFLLGFQNRQFRAAAFGYFGHMWELYAFWAFVPLMLSYYAGQQGVEESRISFFSFCIIAVGGLACVVSGQMSKHRSPKQLAAVLMLLSMLCCLSAPFFLGQPSFGLLILFLLFWGWVVVADSPLFSTVVAQTAPEATRGTALTIVNCIGFSITIVSIQLMNVLLQQLASPFVFLLLAVGPALGLLALWRK